MASRRPLQHRQSRNRNPTNSGPVLEEFDPAVRALLVPIAEMVKRTQAKVSEQNIEKIIEVMLPSHDPVGSVRVMVESDNAAARLRFMQSVPTFTNTQLSEQASHSAKNRSATGSRWKSDGRVFSVPFQGKDYYPAFQFRDGRPRPAVAEVLGILPGTMSQWQRAFWFVSSNPWLDGEAPCDALADRETVLRAARMEGEAVIG